MRVLRIRKINKSSHYFKLRGYIAIQNSKNNLMRTRFSTITTSFFAKKQTIPLLLKSLVGQNIEQNPTQSINP
jgi:hypothetical protein